MPERILNFITGQITFNANKGFPVLFLNICNRENVMLKNVTVSDEGICAGIRYRDYGKLLLAANKSGMELEILRKYGLPEYMKRWKARIGIPIGVAIASLLLLLLSSMLWSIEISGLKSINQQQFVSYLENFDIKTGMFLMNVNCNEIESVVQQYGENVLRANVNLAGCKLFINVEEREPSPQIKNENRICNIIAEKDGEILKADVFAGELKVKPGDAVVKGDLLVEGVRITAEGERRYLQAQAVITARTRECITCQTASNISVKNVVHRKNKFSFYLFGLILGKKAEKHASSSYLSSSAGAFPVGVIRTRENEFSDAIMELSPNASFLISFTDLTAVAAHPLRNKIIAECIVTLQTEGQTFTEAQFYCEEDIAKQEDREPAI